MMFSLRDLMAESNMIEGIEETTEEQVEALRSFVTAEGDVTVYDLERFVSVVQPDAVLRDRPGLDVRVGDHVAPRGGPEVPVHLVDRVLTPSNTGVIDPYEGHLRYETLHPFTDGNGRSGRALWLRTSLKGRLRSDHPVDEPFARIGFLHSFYYTTLSRCDHR